MIERSSILAWIVKNKIKDEKGEELDYTNRLFLLDILSDWSNDIAIKKCAQIGGSVSFSLKVLYAIDCFKWNVIYTFPTDDDVREFVRSKTNKIIYQNRGVFTGLDTDSIELKELNDSFLFFKGTVSKTAAIMTSADCLVHDEADRSDQKTLDTYKSRIANSKFKRRWVFSNPTTEKGVVDLAWLKSDKKEWHVYCNHCKDHFPLKFPDSIDFEEEKFICFNCKNEITDEQRRTGKWLPTAKGKVSGYHISHLMCPEKTASEIIEESKGDQEYFYNFVLGEPYNPGDLSVSKTTILDIWTPKNIETGKWYLGVDVGNIKHYVLGSDKGLVRCGKFTNWQELDDMLKFYKPTTVIDAMPDNTMSRYYCDTYPNTKMSFFQENTANPQTIVWWGERDKNNIVYSNRNRIIDQMIDDMVNAKFLIGFPSDDNLREYIKHWETMRRVKEINTKGIERYEWQSTTDVDHYVFATLYWYLARLGKGSGAYISENPVIPSAILSKMDGDYVNLEATLQALSQGQNYDNN